MNKTKQKIVWNTGHKFTLTAILAIQFAIAYAIGTGELLANSQLAIMPPIALTVLIPVALFLLAYALSARFCEFVLAQNIRTLTTLQLWRVIGFTFLALYSFSVLPGLFAWPAGLGDVSVGLVAAWMVVNLDKDPNYAYSSGFMRFQFFGMLDFVAALATAALSSGAFPSLISNGLTSSALDVWPLNLFPSFIVPGFIILHLVVLLKIRHARRLSLTATNPALAT